MKDLMSTIQIVIGFLSCFQVCKSLPSHRWLYDQSSQSTSKAPAAKSSIVDDILSRPAMPFPAVYVEPDRQTNIDHSRPFLSQAQIERISRASFRNKKLNDKSAIERQEQQGGYRDEKGESEDSYDYKEEYYGTAEESTEEDQSSGKSKTDESSTSLPYQSYRRAMKGSSKSKMGSSSGEGHMTPTKIRLFEKAWKDRGLNFDMEPCDLAMGVTQLKVDLYEHDMEASIGVQASKKVARETSEAYHKEFRYWTRNLTAKWIGSDRYLESKERLKCEKIPLEQRKKILLKKLSKTYTRTYEDWKRRDKVPSVKETQLRSKAMLAGKELLATVRAQTDNETARLEDLNIAQLEFYSRPLEIDLETGFAKEEGKVSRESIKKFLKTYLGKNDQEVIEFVMLRRQFKRQSYNKLRTARYAQDSQSYY